MLATLLAGLVVCAGGYAGVAAWHRALSAPGPLADGEAVVIPHGNIEQVARTLVTSGVLDRSWLFRMAVLVTHRSGALHAAEFVFPAHASIAQVLTILRTGHPVEHHLTIPEGLTAQQITAILAHAPEMTGPVPPITEGSVLPQTYDYEFGATRAAVMDRAKVALKAVLATAWANRVPNLPLATPRDALILASIVERETAKPEERPLIAAVYLNRLRAGMRLQADPTVAYAASNGSGVLDHGLTRADLDSASPFNTYRNAGLPPAPICGPGPDSIEAVLHPADSDDLYFVADGSGGHVFSRTLQSHDAAVAHWRALSAGGKRAKPD